MPFLQPPPTAKLSPVNQGLIDQVKAAATEAVALQHESRAERVRSNVLSADAVNKASKKRVVDTRPGEEVSYNGKIHVVDKVISHGPAGVSKVVIVDSDGKTNTVNSDEVTGLAEPTSELMIPQARDVFVGDFVFVPALDDKISGGVVTGVSPHSSEGAGTRSPLIEVHLYESAKRLKNKYAPVFVMPDGSRVRASSQPKRASPSKVSVSANDILVKGDISPTGIISDGMLEYLQSVGIVLPLFLACSAISGHPNKRVSWGGVTTYPIEARRF